MPYRTLSASWKKIPAPGDLAPTEPILTLLQTGRHPRFNRLRFLGEGSMGMVYAAYDRALHRWVALKCLRAGLIHVPAARAQLIQEARAMARLSHSNVVRLYEVIEQHEQIVLVMEYIQGMRLLDWQRQSRRPRQEILRMYSEAAAGLAAVHSAGIVHRDFKPDNVLVGVDGKPRLVDFGLAWMRPSATTTEDTAPIPDDDAGESPMSLVGALAGTPSYMSPEQYRCQPTDAKSDQFNFCASLYEALYCQLPFGSGSIDELRQRVIEGLLAAPPVDAGVPHAILAVLRRGMASDPRDRFPSMSALLNALRIADAPSPEELGRGFRRYVVLIVALWMILHIIHILHGPQPWLPLASALTMGPALAGWVLWSCQHLRRDAMQRNLLMSLAIAVVVLIALRVLAWRCALPRPAYFLIEQVVLAALASNLALQIHRMFAPIPIVCAAGAILCGLHPDWYSTVVPIEHTLVLTALLLCWDRLLVQRKHDIIGSDA